MIVKASISINIIDLFLHDKGSCAPFSEYSVASALSRMMRDITDGEYYVKCGNECGLNRFIICRDSDGRTEHWTLRADTVEQLRTLTPPRAMEALEQIAYARELELRS
jgi:hypothetical protein